MFVYILLGLVICVYMFVYILLGLVKCAYMFCMHFELIKKHQNKKENAVSLCVFQFAHYLIRWPVFSLSVFSSPVFYIILQTPLLIEAPQRMHEFTFHFKFWLGKNFWNIS